jgi:hypothetical protein
MMAGMGKGLSPLQRQALEVLLDFPTLKRSDYPPACEERSVSLSGWARPIDILNALDRPPTPANRVAMSKALSRLCERDEIVRLSGRLASVGKGYRYARWV